MFDQVNLWLLNSFLLGIVLLQRYPFLGGLAVAVGAHIKLYTLALLLPWGFTQRWKAIGSVILGAIAIAIVETNYSHDWRLWQEFFSYFRSPEKPTNYRNNGIWSLIFNLAKIPNTLLKTDLPSSFVPVIVVGLNLLILAWFVVRLIQRERIYFKLTKASSDRKENSWNYIFRLYGHSIDAIALSLLISPSVWEHHYVLAIPIAVWAIATRKIEQSLLTFLGVFLIFCPTLEIFPFSYHRLLGLLILIYLTAPAFVRDYFVLKPRHNDLSEVTSF